MARIKSDDALEAVVGVRPMPKPTVATRSLGLQLATLREVVDDLEMRVDDVDARVSTLEVETSTEAVGNWESLARAVPQDDGNASTSATYAKVPEPEVDRSEVGDAKPHSDLAEMSWPQSAHATQRDDRRAPAGVFVVLTDCQFEALFGNASPTTGAIEGGEPTTGSDHEVNLPAV